MYFFNNFQDFLTQKENNEMTKITKKNQQQEWGVH